jgi:glyoxylase-like metal-dependent hydrolase (beta-lactamase superfamily II)
VIASAGEALIVDASRNADAYENFLTRQNVRIAATLDTHLHADHISGGAALAARGGVPYYLAREDADGAAIAREDMPRTLRVGDVPVEIVTLPVPGHTLGSTAVLIANRYLLSGDTLLPEGVGRPDLGNKAGEWSGFLYDSLHDVVAHLNDHTLVLPAHAASSDDYDARGRCMRPLNELLRAANISDRSAFLDRVQQTVAQSTQPPEYAEIRRVNLGTPVSAEKAEELEVGMNRCALASGGD